MRRLYAFIAMVVTVLAVILFALPTIQDPNLGIEFKGGYEVVYEVTEKDGQELPDVSDIADVIAQRIDIAGVKNPSVSTVNSGDSVYIRVCVSSEDTNELAEILTLIESDSEVTFTDSEGNIKMYGKDVLADEDGAVLSYQDGSPIVLLNIKDTTTFASVTSELKGENMIGWIGYEGASDDYIGDAAALNGEGTEEQYYAAKKKMIVNATVNDEISTSTAQITGSFSAKEATQIGKLLSAGSMNFVLERTDILKVDGSFGASAFNKSVIAGVIGLIAIIALMIILYKIPGVISSLVLVFYTSIVLFVFDKIGGEYGPDTIAAIVIGLGMAVDCCIILFERLEDELYKGRSLKAAYEESTKKSLSSILDSNITTVIAACALYFFGKRSVKGFATMLLITTVFNVLIMLLLTRLLMFLVVKSGLFDSKKNLFGVKEELIPDINKGETQKFYGKFHGFNFVKLAKPAGIAYVCIFGVAAICILLSLVAGYGNGHGLYFGLDFLEGTTATVNITEVETIIADEDAKNGLALLTSNHDTFDLDEENFGVTEESIRSFLKDTMEYDVEPDSVSIVADYDDENEVHTLSIKVEWVEQFSEITEFENEMKVRLSLDALDEEILDTVTISQQTTSPTMAIATVVNALLSLLFAFALIIVYIAIRFRYTYAIASVVALVIDCLFTISIFAILQVEGLKIETDFVSAILAIIGYSINDTVVIFDRIREIAKETNYGHINDEDRYNIVNKACADSATRSIWTTVSTVLPIFALIFIGSSSTLAFSIAMLAGLISGLFTSLVIAPTLWLTLEKRHMIRLHNKAVKAAQIGEVKKSGQPEELTIIGIND